MSNLRNRARGEVATRPDTTPEAEADLKGKITAMQEQFQLAMPKGVEAAQLVRDAMTVLRQTPKLAECDPQSVLGALMTCAQLGLRVGVLGQAWVLPFYDWRSRGQKAQLIVGYQGLVELAHRSERIASLIARVVYERDEFDVAYGLDDSLVHRPHLGDDGRGEPVGYYAIVKMNTGGHAFVHMTKREAEEHRDAYAMARKNPGKPNEEIVGPWRDNFDAMALKTCVVKLAKWMPKSTDLARAIEADEGVRVDVTPTVPAEEATHHYRTPDTIDAEATETSEPPPAEQAPAVDLVKLRAEVFDAGTSIGWDEWATDENFASGAEGVRVSHGTAEQLDAFLAHIAQVAATPSQQPEETPSDPKGGA